jgi:putative MATE family efflux protein
MSEIASKEKEEIKKTDASKTEENKMGTMPVGKLLFNMSLPMIISMLVQAMYNVVDSVFVSHFDTDALTAVSTAYPLQNLMIGVGSGLGVGLNALISKSLGEKKFDRANEVARQGIFLEVIGYLIFLAVGLFGVKPFMLSQTNDINIINYGVDYGSICCIFAFGLFAQMTFERILQSTGKTFYTMITQAVGAIINIILDPILIFGYFGMPRMGAAGAALATVIGQCIAGALAIYFNIKKNNEIVINFKGFKPEKHIIGKILSIGVPSVIMVAIGSLMTYLLNKILFSFASMAVAVFGCYFKIQSMAFMPVFGLNNGMVPIVSYNYGAKKPDRMVQTIKYGIAVAMAIMIFCLAIMQIFPKQILRIFNASEDMLAMGIPAVRTMSLAFIFAGFSVVCSGMFQALGKGVYSMIVSFARQLVVLIPCAYILAVVTKNLNYVWLAFPIAELMSVCVSALLLARVYKTIVKPLKAV